MSYEWDEAKRVSNLTKHRVDFADAVSALEDEAALTMPEPAVEEEDRFVTLGADLLVGSLSSSTRGAETLFG